MKIKYNIKNNNITVTSDFRNENARAIQENFKTISIPFKNTSDVQNITIDLKVFFKKA